MEETGRSGHFMPKGKLGGPGSAVCPCELERDEEVGSRGQGMVCVLVCGIQVEKLGKRRYVEGSGVGGGDPGTGNVQEVGFVWS